MDGLKVKKNVMAFDFGASSGRAMLGKFDGNKITIEEIHRFSNDPVIVNGTVYWDVLRLLFEIKQSLIKSKSHVKVDSIGIDTWGVDFGLLDKHGDLLSNPVHYRDTRTLGMIEKAFESISREEFYQITGVQFMGLNTVFQLLAIKDSDLLEKADTMLLMPDLFNYFLTGEKVTELSIASTTQLLDAISKKWSERIIDELGIKRDIFTEIVPAGTIVGKTSSQVNEELKMEACDVIAVAGHDTQSAMIAVPSQEDNFVFLSCGTWSLLGTELEHPIINEKTECLNLTNETGYRNKTSFLKNIIGLWLIQECKHHWERVGDCYSFSELVEMASETKPFKCFIDPDDVMFVPTGNMPKRIKAYCKTTNQPIPQTIGEIVRCIIESLAMKYRVALEELEDCTGRHYSTIYMVGGGIQNELLCQSTADACGRPVSAGPVEATVLGNMAIQLMATNAIGDVNEAREVIRNSQEMKYYMPKNCEIWNAKYMKFKKILKRD